MGAGTPHTSLTLLFPRLNTIFPPSPTCHTSHMFATSSSLIRSTYVGGLTPSNSYLMVQLCVHEGVMGVCDDTRVCRGCVTVCALRSTTLTDSSLASEQQTSKAWKQPHSISYDTQPPPTNQPPTTSPRTSSRSTPIDPLIAARRRGSAPTPEASREDRTPTSRVSPPTYSAPPEGQRLNTPPSCTSILICDGWRKRVAGVTVHCSGR